MLRRVLAGLLLVPFLLIASGCGGSDDSANPKIKSGGGPSMKAAGETEKSKPKNLSD